MYNLIFISADFKGKSFKDFIESGKAKTNSDRVIEFLQNNPDSAFSQSQLVAQLRLARRSSICWPINNLCRKGIIEIVGSYYDAETNREVGAYQIVSKQGI